MGNMSNPCINRWGLNSFWRHYWYSDNSYSLYLRQDSLLLDLLKIYLKFSTNLPPRFFANSYWNKNKANEIKPSPKTRHYNWVTVRDSAFGFTDTHPIRLSRAETFDTQVCVLRYNSWMILNFYWFQPNKRKAGYRAHIDSREVLNLQQYSVENYASLTRLKKVLSLRPSAAYRF